MYCKVVSAFYFGTQLLLYWTSLRPVRPYNLTNLSSRRPISLLSVLRKGLERLVARRLAYAATQAGLISKQYARALPGTSVTDLV